MVVGSNLIYEIDFITHQGFFSSLSLLISQMDYGQSDCPGFHRQAQLHRHRQPGHGHVHFRDNKCTTIPSYFHLVGYCHDCDLYGVRWVHVAAYHWTLSHNAHKFWEKVSEHVPDNFFPFLAAYEVPWQHSPWHRQFCLGTRLISYYTLWPRADQIGAFRSLHYSHLQCPTSEFTGLLGFSRRSGAMMGYLERTTSSKVLAASLPKLLAAFGLAPEINLRSRWQELSALEFIMVTPNSFSFSPNCHGMWPGM